MKTKLYIKAALVALAAGSLTACDDYLDKMPISEATPENYFTQDSHLEAYANARYTEVIPSSGNWSYGTYGADAGTDNMVKPWYDGIYVKGNWKTGMTDGNYSFGTINTINYFFENVLGKYAAKQIIGDDSSIRHYIGEMYYMRAYVYFVMLQRFGDFPIITKCLPDDMTILSENSRRYPRNEVARFILSDLDSAAVYMDAKKMAKTRLNGDVARLMKSRVALFEGSWLKNFAGTPFVPGDKAWPGYTKEYNKDFKFAAGSLEAEYNWFFEQSMAAAKAVADKASLTTNTGVVPQTEGATQAALEAENPWLAMFATLDLEKNNEVMLWREYSRTLGIVHNINVYAQKGNCATGMTRGYVEAFLCKDGLPIYASPLYVNDSTITNVRIDRDPRLFVLLKEPTQKNVLIKGVGTHAQAVEPRPKILDRTESEGYSTGYALRKGNYYEQQMCGNGDNYTAVPIYRSVEALLNYIEASYERTGALDATAKSYWTKIRKRHTGMDTDFQKTIDATDMTKEAAMDWGAYSGGQVIDAVRYNIRRERRCELIAEDFRWMDLKRWRAFDQLITNPYHIEGIHVWGTPMEKWYPAVTLKKTINPKERSSYFRPFETTTTSEVYDGLTWSMAHYLRPMPIKEMILTSPNHDDAMQSPIYQNPYWPSEPNLPAIQ